MTNHMSVAVIVASTRPERHGPAIAAWIQRSLTVESELDLSIVDLADAQLPLLDEPRPAQDRAYIHDHTKRWSEIIEAADGFIIVTPEHNRTIPASLKNALDCLYWEWEHKPVAFVSYSGGPSGGIRAVEMTKQVASALSMLPLNQMVNLPRINSLIVDGVLDPPPGADSALTELANAMSKYLAASQVLRRA